jgi:glycosyltransferase involved in cell wall biosynthesis
MLIDIEKLLLEHGRKNFQFLIVGEGSEHEHLEKHLKNAVFTGFLDGEKLSEAYANMDVFVFPSTTDAFGNVAQEALASGVVPIVTDMGGPKFIVKDGVTGFVAKNTEEFTKHIEYLIDHPEIARTMRAAGLEAASDRSWNSVFASVFDAYQRSRVIWAEQRNIEI